ncbi:MAG: enoyl-CoA hydratase-related protein [Pseudomonadales bacterium]
MSVAMDVERLTLSESDGVLSVILNRPEKLNAIDRLMESELSQVLEQADRCKAIRVVVIQGAGRAFSAGHDISDGGGAPDAEGVSPPSPQEDLALVREGAGRFARIMQLSIPVIASVHGYCMGIGTCLALNCDLVVAAEDAEIGFPPVRWGGSPPTHMWTYLVGPQWAKYMLLTGDTIDGRTAERIGLVFRSVPAAELTTVAFELAAKMARIPRDLLVTNKGICNKALDLMGRTTLQQLAHEADVFGHFSPDAREFFRIVRSSGIKAALEWQQSRFGSSDYR